MTMTGKHRERQQRQLPVQFQHHHHDAEQREEIPEDGHHAGSEQVVQHVHVRRHARHQAAHRIAVEEAHLQPLQVEEDLLAQVVHHLLPHHLHGERLREFQQEAEEHRGQEEHKSDLRDARHRIAAQETREDGRKVLAARRVKVTVHFHLSSNTPGRPASIP